MTDPSPANASLVEAAARLADELDRYEKLTDEVKGVAVNSEKTLARATKAMQEAAACHERIMEHVGVMSSAMVETRTRQQLCAERLVEAGQRLSERATMFQELLNQYAAAGALAGALNARASEIALRRKAGEPVDDAVRELFVNIEEAISLVATLLESAKEAGFVDLGRQADSFRQQLLAARNQLKLASATGSS